MRQSNFVKSGMVIMMCMSFVRGLMAGAPPGTSEYAPAKKPSYERLDKLTGIVFDLGFYSPSLKMVREDLEYYGFAPMKNKLVYNIGISNHNKGLISQHFFSYWSGVSERADFVEKMDFYMYHANVYFEITAISDLISPERIFKPELGITIRDVVAVMQDKYPLFDPDQYVTTVGMTMDFGPSLRFEIFLPVEPLKNIAFTLAADYIVLSLPLMKLDIFDTNIPDMDVTDDYVNHNSEKFKVETNGLILKGGIGIYF
ncbi:MAG: hypothetical protein WBJ87_00130 [Candidatus Hydrothermia bacterium]